MAENWETKMESPAVSLGTRLPNPLPRARASRAGPVTGVLRGTIASAVPLISCHDNRLTALQHLPPANGNPTAVFSRREAIGFGLGAGLFDFVLSGWLQQSEAAEQLPCELKVAPSGLAYCDKVVGYGAEAVKGQLIKVIVYPVLFPLYVVLYRCSNHEN